MTKQRLMLQALGFATLLCPILLGGVEARSQLVPDAIDSQRAISSLPDGRVAHGRGFAFQNVHLAMSDSTHINTDVYLPDQGSGPWPTFLYRTPYNIASDNIGWLATQGYAVVCQDIRGRFGSEGIDQMFRDEGWGPNHRDGLETTQWIVAQPWCNGRIATYGGSANGITQNLLAGAYPDSVRCMSVYVAPADLYRDLFFPGGAFRQQDIVGWLANQGSSYMLDSLYAHPNDDEFWSWLDAEPRHALETIPTFQHGGWFDLFPKGTIASFTGLQYGGGPGARGNQKLIMGPWTHGTDPSHAGELVFPNAGMEQGEALIGSFAEWIDYWIWDQPNRIMDRPPIAYYLMGDVTDPNAPGNAWKTAMSWPPPSTSVSWYLRAGGALSPAPPLFVEAPGTYAYDPLHPVPTRGGGNLTMEAGPYDQRMLNLRSDVLVFKTPLLTQPIEIVGDVQVELFVSSDRLDTDFTAKLCDVYPDGRAMLICDGIVRARHRLGMDREDFLTPGEIVPVTIDLWETALVFNAGHRILVAISSSNSPRFDPNPNTGEPFMQSTTTLIAHNSVYHQPGLESRLVLPVTGAVPAEVDDLSDESTADLPPSLALSSLGPNPFVERTAWRLSLPPPGTMPSPSISIVDCTGRSIRALQPSTTDAAEQTLAWDGRDDHGRLVPAGVYTCVVARADVRRASTVVRVR